MFLGKVIGNVVATQKDPKFQGAKLLQRVNLDLDLNRCPGEGGQRAARPSIRIGQRLWTAETFGTGYKDMFLI